MGSATVLAGRFSAGIKRAYRSADGLHYFNFTFSDNGDRVDIHCTRHPSLAGRDADVNKTHLYSSGRICFVSGQEPTSQARAEQLAKQWAEYFLSYRRTGRTQS